MSEKILVAYATRAGSTAEIAETIGQTLALQNGAVDVLPLEKVKSLKGYKAVVLGSAIRIGHWLPEAVRFVEQNRDSLAQMPAAFFAVHLMNLGSDEANRKARLAYLDPVRKLVTPKKEAFFAGVGDYKKVSWLDRLLARAVKAPEGDFRDWTAVRAWAEELRLAGFTSATM